MLWIPQFLALGALSLDVFRCCRFFEVLNVSTKNFTSFSEQAEVDSALAL